jgi:acylphosphatase
MNSRRAHLRICGRVQGVGFRFSAAQQARQLGLMGWVRNCADGTVEALAEGSMDALGAFIAWCGRGPAGARVDDVSVDWRSASGEFSGFEIRA